MKLTPCETILPTVLGFLLGIALLVAIAFLDPAANQRRDRVDTLAPGPYVVSAVKHHREVYLIHTTTDDGAVSPIPDWSPMLEQAWRFPSWEEAYTEAQRIGGTVLALRRVVG